MLQVGIITPYKGQRAFITRLFEEALGPAAARAVRVETVDSFQGKQMDVVILSCVRAGGGSSGGWGAVKGGGLRAAKLPGVGFLADTRRMNVAITRARLALWVLGHHATLQADPTWRALFDDAAARGCLVGNASAERLFPPGCPPGGLRHGAGAAGGQAGAAGGQLGLGGQPLLQGGQLALTAGVSSAAAGSGVGPGGEATPPPAAAEEGPAVAHMDWLQAERLRQEKALQEKRAKFEQLQKQKQEAAAKAAGTAAGAPAGSSTPADADQDREGTPAGGTQEAPPPPQMLTEVRAIMAADAAGRLAPVQVGELQVGPQLVAFTRVLNPLVRWVVEESMVIHQRMQQQQGPAAG